MRGVAILLAASAIGCFGDDDRGRVHVIVTRDGMPIPEATVIFHDAAGTVFGVHESDDEGGATGEIGANGMVTVVDPTVSNSLHTITNLAIGASIKVSLRDGAAYVPGGTLAIEPPPGGPPAGTSAYIVVTPCDSHYAPSLPTTIELYNTCGTLELPIILFAWSEVQLDVPGTAVAYVTGTARSGRFAPTAAWSTTCQRVLVEQTTLAWPALRPRLGGRAFQLPELAFCENAPPPGYVVMPTLDFGEGVLAHGLAYLGGPQRTASVLTDHESAPSTLAYHTGDLLLGDPQLLRVDGNGAAWTRDPALASADVLVADLAWFSPGDSLTWRFVLPATATEIAIPDPPPDVTWPSLHAASSRPVGLRYVEASWTDDLDELHEMLPLVMDGASSPLPLPPLATLRDLALQLPDPGGP